MPPAGSSESRSARSVHAAWLRCSASASTVASTGTRRVDHRVDQLRPLRAHLQFGPDAAAVEAVGCEVGGGAVAVAAVRDEDQPCCIDHDPRQRPAEPGEPADVGGVRQHHRAPVESSTYGGDATDEVGRGKVRRHGAHGTESAQRTAARAARATSRSTAADDLDAVRSVEDERQAVARLLVATHQLEQLVVAGAGGDRRRQAVRLADDRAVGGDATRHRCVRGAAASSAAYTSPMPTASPWVTACDVAVSRAWARVWP